MDVQYFFLFHWVIELTCSFGSSSTWRRVFELFPRAVEDASQFIHLPGNF